MQTDLTIRVAALRDMPEVDALLWRSYPKLLKHDYPPSVMVTAIPLISRAQPGLLASGSYYLAEGGGGRLLGAGGWSRSRHTEGAAEIRHVATDPEAVRQGVGRALLERIFAEAEGQGHRRFDCLSTRTAVPFYRAIGFVELGPVEISLAEGVIFPAIRMRRVL